MSATRLELKVGMFVIVLLGLEEHYGYLVDTMLRRTITTIILQ